MHKVLQEVAAEDHVDPGVAAAVQAGQQRRQGHRCVLGLWRTDKGGKIINLQQKKERKEKKHLVRSSGLRRRAADVNA